MKKSYTFLILVFFFGLYFSQAQEDEYRNFRLLMQSGIGSGIATHDNEVSYALNTSSAELLVNYKFSKYFGVASGVGFNELRGNAFNSLGNFFHERSQLKIPVLFTADYYVSDKIKILVTLGAYAQTILRDELSFVDFKAKNVYEGWNFGSQFSIGFLFEISENYSVGLNYLGHSDVSKFKTQENAPFSDKQKIINMNSVGLSLLIEF